MEDLVSLSEITADDFSPHLNSTFRLTRDGRPDSDLTLIDVRAVGKGNGRQPFSLQFTGTPGEVLPQHIYRISHDRMGVMDIFIVPVAATADHTQYEAIFN